MMNANEHYIPQVGQIFLHEKMVTILQDKEKKSFHFPSQIAQVLNYLKGGTTNEMINQVLTGPIGLKNKVKLKQAIRDVYYFYNKTNLIGSGSIEEMLSFIFTQLLAADVLVKLNSGENKKNIENLNNSMDYFAVITKDRIETLSACLESYIKHFGQHESQAAILVACGSTGKTNREDFVQSLENLARQYSRSISYISNTSRKKFKGQLVKHGVSEKVAQFLLVEQNDLPAYGINRNAVLLATKGKRVFSADDDTLCEIYRSKKFKNEIQCNYAQRKQNIYELMDESEISDFAIKQEHSFLESHGKFLGKKIEDIVSQKETDKEIRINSVDYFKLLHKNPKVVLTFNGLVGDSGSNIRFNRLKSARTNEIPKGQIDQFLDSRCIVKASESYNFSLIDQCMAGFMGMDNECLLPPFFPYFRMEDDLFAKTIYCLFGEEYIATFLPECLLHRPPQKRSLSTQEAIQIEGIPMPSNEIIDCILSSFYPCSEYKSIENRYQLLGKHIIDFTNLERDEYENRLNDFYDKQLLKKIRYYSSLKSSKGPEQYRQFVDEAVQTHLSKWERKPILADPELITTFGAKKATQITQNYIRTFGELLQEWPKIISIVRKLEKQGIRLFETIGP